MGKGDSRSSELCHPVHLLTFLATKAGLYRVSPMKMPENMAMTPRSFQLQAAAQGLYCLEGPMKTFLLGDEMGVGKTLTAILMMWSKINEPGMSLVLCPRSLCETWVSTINGAWEQV